MDMPDGHWACTFSKDMQHGHAGLHLKDMQHAMQHECTAGKVSKDMQH
jgi:hypothetical protein